MRPSAREPFAGLSIPRGVAGWAERRAWGKVAAVAPKPPSEVASVSRLARATLGEKVNVDWDGFEKNYDLIRGHISHVVDGCENYNQRIRQEGGFVMANLIMPFILRF